MKALAEYSSLVQVIWPSLMTAGAVAVGGSQVGTFVILRREGMMALALPQITAVGVALSLRYGWPAVVPGLLAAALGVMVLAWSKRHGAGHWLLPSLYIAGLSISFLIIANAGEHVSEMQSRFTGIDVAVDPLTAWVTSPLIVLVGCFAAFLWRRWLALAQSPDACELAGLNPARWDVLFLSLLAAVLMLGTSALGAVMVLVMLFLPPAAVRPWCQRIPTALIASAMLALIEQVIGFVLSVEMDWPLSHSVGGAACAVLALSYVLSLLLPRR